MLLVGAVLSHPFAPLVAFPPIIPPCVLVEVAQRPAARQRLPTIARFLPALGTVKPAAVGSGVE